MRRREPLPRRGGSGSRFVRRQSRRALNPGWRRAQRAESREAGQRPASSRCTCRAAEFGGGAWAPGSTVWTGAAPPQGESAPVSRTGKVDALQNQASGAYNAPNVRKRAFGPLSRGVHAAAAEFGGGAWASGSTVWTGAASPQGESAPVSRTGKVGALQNQTSSAHNASNVRKRAFGPLSRGVHAALRSSEKGLRLLVLPLGREPLPAEGSGSCFAYRQSRRASKPDKQRAQRVECQKAGLRPAFSRRARRAAEFGKRA